MSAIKNVTDESFDVDVLQSEVPVVVDFYADWCGPCKTVAPILGDVAESYSNKVKVVKLDVDNNQKVSAKYNIKGIPTIMAFSKGAVAASRVGALSKNQLMDFIEHAIGN